MASRSRAAATSLEARSGAGTTVSVYLPRSMAQVESAALADPVSADRRQRTHPGGGGRPGAARHRGRDAGGLGYQVVQAPDAASGARRYPERRTVDLLFTDVMMPGPLRSTEMVEFARGAAARHRRAVHLRLCGKRDRPRRPAGPGRDFAVQALPARTAGDQGAAALDRRPGGKRQRRPPAPASRRRNACCWSKTMPTCWT